MAAGFQEGDKGQLAVLLNEGLKRAQSHVYAPVGQKPLYA